jgi:uncharacterized membrane protein YfcA
VPAGAQAVAGVLAGLGIGIVTVLMGVAGGELLIPTIVLLYAVDLKLAGSLSLAVSLPTMIVAFARYSRDGSFVVLRQHRRFVIAMAAGSVTGTIVGGLMLGIVPTGALLPLPRCSSAQAWSVAAATSLASEEAGASLPPAAPGVVTAAAARRAFRSRQRGR